MFPNSAFARCIVLVGVAGLASTEPAIASGPSACPAPDPRLDGLWADSAAPFEHADSARTHLFTRIQSPSASDFSSDVEISVEALRDLPAIYNSALLPGGDVVVLGGMTGGGERPQGPYVARVDRETWSVEWRTELLDSIGLDEWNYPGVVAAHANGDLYAAYGYRLARIDPATGSVLDITVLPTVQEPRDTAYNGFVAASDGVLILKSHHRPPGCETDGFRAFLECGTEGVSPSVLVAVDPDTMEILSTVRAEELIGGRISASRVDGREVVYAPGLDRLFRFNYDEGVLERDATWGPVAYREGEQTPGTAAAALNGWVVIQNNALPTDAPLSLTAVSQADSDLRHTITPFGDQPRSMNPSMPSVDPSSMTVFASDGLAGAVGAYRLDPQTGFEEVWRVDQSSFSFSILIGPSDDRVFIATDALESETFFYEKEQVVWRDAATGRELARSPALDRIGGATMLPACGGEVFYPSTRAGAFYRLSVETGG